MSVWERTKHLYTIPRSYQDDYPNAYPHRTICLAGINMKIKHCSIATAYTGHPLGGVPRFGDRILVSAKGKTGITFRWTRTDLCGEGRRIIAPKITDLLSVNFNESHTIATVEIETEKGKEFIKIDLIY